LPQGGLGVGLEEDATSHPDGRHRLRAVAATVVVVAARLSLVAILLAGWGCGLWPALVAWGLATLSFAYFFTPPFDSPRVDLGEVPRLTIWATPDMPHGAIFHFALRVERARLPGDMAPGSRRRSS